MSRLRSILPPVSVAILLVTLFIGLRPMGYDFSNHVSWLEEKSGLHFGVTSLAYSRLDKKLYDRKLAGRGVFSIQLLIKPANYDLNTFNHIFSIHAGSNRRQLVIGQWRSHIIVMNGDDYAHRKKIKRIHAQIPDDNRQALRFTVTSGSAGARIYFDETLMQSEPDIDLRIPEGGEPLLSLGNSVYGTNSWQGDILGLAIYNHELSQATLTGRNDSRLGTTAQNNTKPVLLYRFNEQTGATVTDRASRTFHLQIPARMRVLKKIILAKPWPERGITRSLIQDATINLAGFIPLGFIFALTFFTSFAGLSRKQAILLSVSICFATSLFIEMLQGWMATRSSQSLDLILNTLGAWLGALFIKMKVWTK